MFISRENLKALARSNVCEIKFRRRNPVAGKPLFRRMLCTSNQRLLMSFDGRLTLNYRPTYPVPYKHNRHHFYDPDAKNLVILWDILMQDYRAINMSYCNLIAQVPANQKFWEYYRAELMNKSPSEKTNWMNS